jgi:hypothetical protein
MMMAAAAATCTSTTSSNATPCGIHTTNSNNNSFLMNNKQDQQANKKQQKKKKKNSNKKKITTKRTRNVFFEAAEIVEFEPTVFTTSVTSGGVPLGLSLQERSRTRRRLDSFELERQKLRICRQQYMEEGYLEPQEREEILNNAGCDEQKMAKVEEEVNQIILERRESNEMDFECMYGGLGCFEEEEEEEEDDDEKEEEEEDDEEEINSEEEDNNSTDEGEETEPEEDIGPNDLVDPIHSKINSTQLEEQVF